MSRLTDADLLRRASEGSREALAEIAHRYAGFVYTTALRQLRDRHLAEDVTQAVFVILVRKIKHLRRGTLLHGWLFTTTRYAANNAKKMLNRRIHHERIGAGMRSEIVEADHSEPIAELLDDALESLRGVDRNAVLLSYFGGGSWREVGEAMGTTEEAARKRVSRALAQMREFFAGRGVDVSTGVIAAGLASAASASVPAGLVESVTSCMTTSAFSATTGATVGDVISLMTLTNLKIAASFAGALLLTIGLTGATLTYRATEQAAAASAPAAASASVSLKNDITVQLLEVSDPQARSWNGDGTPAQPVNLDADIPGGGSAQIVARVVAPDALDFDARWSVKPARTVIINYRMHGPEQYVYVSMEPQDDQKAVNLRVEFASGEWKTTAAREGTNGMVMTGTVAFGELYEVEGRRAMTITDELLDQQVQIVAIDNGGEEHPASNRFSGVGNFFRQTSVDFDLPANEIARIEFRTRPYDQWVEFKNVTLVAGQNQGFEVTSSVR